MKILRRSILALYLMTGLTASKALCQQTLPTKYAVILYANQVSAHTGNSQLLAAHYANKGGGSFTWQKDIPETGDYELALSYSAKVAGQQLTLSAGSDSVSATLAATSGYYLPTSNDWSNFNCERRLVPGKLHLQKGVNTVTLQLSGPNEVNVYALDLVPLAKKELAVQDIRSAQQARPDTKWFADAGYGVMFHWTSQSAPETGPAKSYKDAVDAFNVDAFVKMVAQTGASYVIFTMNHAEPYFPAPLKNWEKEYPGHTTRRDLVAVLADGLAKQHIRLILYLATHVYSKFDKVSDEEFTRLNTTLLTEIGDRYKTKVAGYWLDGWYQCFQKHPGFDFEQFYKVCKTGNKDRLICLNSWAYPAVSMWQDYWSGEDYIIGNPATAQLENNGPGTGLQSQRLIVMEKDDWLHSTLNAPIKSPDLNADDLAAFISSQQGKGPVTVNIQIYQDGRIDDAALDVMKAVKAKLRK